MGKYLDKADEVMGLKPNNRGKWVEFDSPLYGPCYGRLKEVVTDVYLLTDHSVQKNEVRIPGHWVKRIVDEPATTKKLNKRIKGSPYWLKK